MELNIITLKLTGNIDLTFCNEQGRQIREKAPDNYCAFSILLGGGSLAFCLEHR